MKRSPMPRSSKPLRRRTPLRQVSAKRLARVGRMSSTFGPRPSTGHRVERDSAAIVRGRSGGVCEIQLPGCVTAASERSHRVARGMGGCHGAAKVESDRPSDLLDSCWSCHALITRYAGRVRARSRGWVLPHGAGVDPARCKVLRRGVWVFLDDVGGVHDYETAGA